MMRNRYWTLLVCVIASVLLSQVAAAVRPGQLSAIVDGTAIYFGQEYVHHAAATPAFSPQFEGKHHNRA